MNNRYWIFGTAVIVIAVAALGWFLGIQPRLAEAAAADTQRAGVAAQNAAYEVTLADLRTRYEDIDDLRADVAELREAVPAQADYSGFVAELNTIATQAGVGIAHLTVSEASWYASAAPTAPADAPPAEPTDGATPTPSPTDAATAPPADPVGVPVPLSTQFVNGSNFVAIPVQIELSGDPAGFMNFVSALQLHPRLFLVTGFSSGGDVPPTVRGLLYVLLDGSA
jgi:Tfp pilus assembly protein PilO